MVEKRSGYIINKYHRDILKTLNKDSFDKLKIEWSGKPNYLGYLFSNKGFFWKMVGAGIVIWYEKFQMGMLSVVCIGVLAIYVLFAMIRCMMLSYYITKDGPVVQSGSAYYLLPWKDLLQEEYFVYAKPFEAILGCKTLEFTRSYITSRKQDVWKEKARFWAVRGHRELDEIIRKHLKK